MHTIVTATTPNGHVLERRTISAPTRSSKEYKLGMDKAYREMKERHGDCYIFTESHGG